MLAPYYYYARGVVKKPIVCTFLKERIAHNKKVFMLSALKILPKKATVCSKRHCTSWQKTHNVHLNRKLISGARYIPHTCSETYLYSAGVSLVVH